MTLLVEVATPGPSVGPVLSLLCSLLVVQDPARLPFTHRTPGSVVPAPVTHQLLRRPLAATAGVTATSCAVVISGLPRGAVVAA